MATEYTIEEDPREEANGITEVAEEADTLEKGQVSGASGWFNSWTKKAKGDSTLRSVGELLSRPGKLYREIQEENEILRKRVEELENSLFLGTEPANKTDITNTDIAAAIFGGREHSNSQALHATNVQKEKGILIGSSSDSKLLKIQWHRKVRYQANYLKNDGTDGSELVETEASEEWRSIPSATKGHYQPCADDIGCALMVELSFTRLFRNFSNSPLSRKSYRIHSQHASIWPDNAAGEQISRIVKSKRAEFSDFVDMFNPTQEYTLFVHVQNGVSGSATQVEREDCIIPNVSSFENCHLVLKLSKTCSTIAEEGNREIHSEANSIVSNEVLEFRYPETDLLVQLGPPRSKILHLIQRSSEKETKMSLVAADSMLRDIVALTIRTMRRLVSEGQNPLGYAYDYPQNARIRKSESSKSFSSLLQSVRGSTISKNTKTLSASKSNQSSCSCRQEQRSIRIDTPRDEKELCVCECMYESVASSGLFEEEVGSRSSRATSSPGLKLRSMSRSMSSLFSSAIDPFTHQFSGNDTKFSEDIYSTTGFDIPFKMSLDLEEGEGLGITLGTFKTKLGASLVCVTGFCQIEAGTKSGQIENSGLVSVGDALKAVNGEEVAPAPEFKGSIKRLVSLMNMARKAPEQAQLDKTLHNGKASVLLTFAPKKVAVTAQSHKMDSDIEVPANVAEQKEVESTGAGANERNPRPDFAKKYKDLLPRFRSTSDYELSGKSNEKANPRCNECLNWEAKINEVKATAYALTRDYENKINGHESHIRDLCELLQQERSNAEEAFSELSLLTHERDRLRAEIVENTEEKSKQVKELEGKIQKAVDREQYWREESEKEKKKRITSEESMGRLAVDGEAWVNALATKEQALRALESDLDALKVRNETLQGLLDSVREDADQSKAQLKVLEAEKSNLQTAIDNAENEADRLTSNMNQQKESFKSELEVARKKCRDQEQELEKLRPELSVVQTQTIALKEAIESMEARAAKASAARQDAEASSVELRNRNKVLEAELADLRSAPAPQRNNFNPTDTADREPDQDYILTLDKLRRAEAKSDEKELRIESLRESNDSLRAQVKSLKSRVQSLSVEVGKVVKVEKLQRENNDLLVKSSLAEAAKMEALDELNAYKRALMQFAEQAKRDESRGDGQPWSNRPKIFDHLYKQLNKR